MFELCTPRTHGAPDSERDKKKTKKLETLETKASSPAGQCIPAGCYVTLARRVLITKSVITMRSRLFPANSASVCLRFAKSRPQFCESCGATYKPFRRFLDFSQFLTAISRKLWRHLATNVRTMLSVCKCYPFRKKRWKLRRNRAINGNAMLVRTMHPSNEHRADLGAWQKNIVTNTIFSHIQRARIVRSSQTLHGDRAHRDHQKGVIHFSIQRIVFPTGRTKKFGLIHRRAVSQQ